MITAVNQWAMTKHGRRLVGHGREAPVSGIRRSAIAVACVAAGLTAGVRGQGQNAPAVFSPTAGDYATADIRVITPGVVFASGLPDIAADFTKETGKKVGIVVVGMGTIVEEMTKKTPPPDVIVLPFQLMTTLSLDGGVAPGTFTPLGRNAHGSRGDGRAHRSRTSRRSKSSPPRSRARRR